MAITNHGPLFTPEIENIKPLILAHALRVIAKRLTLFCFMIMAEAAGSVRQQPVRNKKKTDLLLWILYHKDIVNPFRK